MGSLGPPIEIQLYRCWCCDALCGKKAGKRVPIDARGVRAFVCHDCIAEAEARLHRDNGGGQELADA